MNRAAKRNLEHSFSVLVSDSIVRFLLGALWDTPEISVAVNDQILLKKKL